PRLPGALREQSAAERSDVEAAVRRAADHLGLAWRRLEEERVIVQRKDAAGDVEAAYTAARAAWQVTNGLLDRDAGAREGTLDDLRAGVTQALGAVERALQAAQAGEPIHASRRGEWVSG